MISNSYATNFTSYDDLVVGISDSLQIINGQKNLHQEGSVLFWLAVGRERIRKTTDQEISEEKMRSHCLDLIPFGDTSRSWQEGDKFLKPIHQNFCELGTLNQLSDASENCMQYCTPFQHILYALE